MTTDAVGVVVAGGKSSRMGWDKAAIKFGGVPLLERTVAVLSEVFDSVLVAGESTTHAEVETVADVIPHGGPLSGLDAIYRRAEGKAVFLLAVDLPFVDAGVIREIVAPGIGPRSARVPITQGRMQPLCALYGPELGSLVRDRLESDDRSMFRFVASIEDVDLVEMDQADFDNVNTESDLAAALRRFGLPRNTR